MNFDIDVSSILFCVDIEVPGFDIEHSSISYCVDIEVQAFDIEDSSISYWIDIECYNLRYRRLSDFRYSISNVKTFDIELSYRTRYWRSFSDLQYRRLHLRYRNIPISKVWPSISKVGKVPDVACLYVPCNILVSLCPCHAMIIILIVLVTGMMVRGWWLRSSGTLRYYDSDDSDIIIIFLWYHSFDYNIIVNIISMISSWWVWY